VAAQRIVIQNLVKVYGGGARAELLAVDNANLAVGANEFVCILGPSGCGKSTILNILSGLDTAYTGRAEVVGGEHALRIGYVFQDPRLLPWLTVEDNIHHALKWVGIPRESWSQRSGRQLELVGLEGFRRHYPHELSGGMQQRASIARALAIEPDVLLMDEPFSGLDELTARSLRQLLLELWLQTQKTVLFVTHNCFEATFLADRIVLMTRRPGRVYGEVPVTLPRPRDYDDPAVFAVSAGIVKDFLATIGAEQTPEGPVLS
jgi:NitT/TauT family transport system ATP-binding protein